MDINPVVIIGMLITFSAMGFAGVYTMRKIKNSEDFTVAGRKSTAVMVAGTIVGSCVGSGATIGTAQMAFTRGIVGWWQTLGLSIGVLVLGLVLAQAVYKSRVETVPQLLEKTYGQRIRPIVSVFTSVAIFLSIISQTMGFLPLVTSILPVTIAVAAVICVALTLTFVVFGGIFATSIGGLVKITIILGSCLLAGTIALVSLGGPAGIVEKFEFHPWRNMFARGAANDLAIGLGFVLGVLVTQVYVQAILSAVDAKAARNGAIIAAFMTLPVGLFGVFVGMYMSRFFPDIASAQALPRFMLEHFHPVIAGIFIGGLMLAALGSNAGLCFGTATMLSRDVYKKIREKAGDKEMLVILRTFIVIIAVLAGIFAVTRAGTMIQQFVFLSFGLRTTVVLVPMLFALYYRGRLSKAAGMAAILAGPIANIFWNLVIRNNASELALLKTLKGWDPIYVGLSVALIGFVIANSISKEDLRKTPAAQ